MQGPTKGNKRGFEGGTCKRGERNTATKNRTRYLSLSCNEKKGGKSAEALSEDLKKK